VRAFVDAVSGINRTARSFRRHFGDRYDDEVMVHFAVVISVTAEHGFAMEPRAPRQRRPDRARFTRQALSRMLAARAGQALSGMLATRQTLSGLQGEDGQLSGATFLDAIAGIDRATAARARGLVSRALAAAFPWRTCRTLPRAPRIAAAREPLAGMVGIETLIRSTRLRAFPFGSLEFDVTTTNCRHHRLLLQLRLKREGTSRGFIRS
jgi:hypothetical protein